MTINPIFYGKETPLPERVPLRAGPLTMIYENGDLRYVRLGDKLLLLRVYSAARDRNWGTAPAVLSEVQMEIEDDHFSIKYVCDNKFNDIDFVWQGEISGAADGTVRFAMDGVARASFSRNRLGFCVLHPMQLAGSPARITHVDGSTEEAVFPRNIAPQMKVNGLLRPVPQFEEMRALAHQVQPGLWAAVEFEGDIFETEDQRNWTDASYKTYCTPLRLPYPVEVKVGTRVIQTITLRLEGAVPARKPARKSARAKVPDIRFNVGSAATPLPALGLGLAGHGQALGRKEIERLKALKLAHLRVDLPLWEPQWSAQLKRATREAKALGAGLEIGLFVSEAAEAELGAFVKAARPVTLPVSRYLIFHCDEVATSPATVALARRHLGESAVLYSGTNMFFTELNCNRPDPAMLKQLNGLCYSFNPQVHAFDNSSLVEAIEAQGETIRSYKAFAKRMPLAITAITLKPRFNLSGPGPEPAESRLQGDPRQMSLFGAAWTLGSLKYVAQAGGVASATYYETTGPRGVMGAKQVSESPWPQGVFPLYHVLADVAEFGGQVLASKSSEPLAVDGLVLRKSKRTRVLLANYSDQPRAVSLSKLGPRATLKYLDESNAALAIAAPEKFRAQPGVALKTQAGALTVELRPYGLARIDS